MIVDFRTRLYKTLCADSLATGIDMAAKQSEFEEKEFEAPLYNQLSCGNNLVWSPGQVFEEHIGVDHAVFLSDPGMWRFFGNAGPFRGAFLHRYEWEYIWRHRRERRRLPNFRLNLFLQAKRSHYYSCRPRHLRPHLERCSCWRFDVEPTQQEALERVADRLNNRAIVCYAAPAFHRLSQLYAHTVKGTIVPNSTFPEAKKLSGHRSFYYTKPGGSGITNDDPEIIEGAGLEDLLSRLGGGVKAAPLQNPGALLKELGYEINQVILEAIPDDNPRKGMYFESLRHSERFIQELDGPREAIRGFVQVTTFSTVFNTEWYVISENI